MCTRVVLFIKGLQEYVTVFVRVSHELHTMHTAASPWLSRRVINLFVFSPSEPGRLYQNDGFLGFV